MKNENLLTSPRESVDDEPPTEKPESDEQADGDAETDSGKPVNVFKRRGIVAHRGILACDEKIFLETT
jgi:hypothetical protein